MTTTQPDLFGHVAPTNPLIGRAIAMEQTCRCGINVALIYPGRGPHAAELRCRNCDAHWQWLSHADYRAFKEFAAEIDRLYGVPPENFTYRIPKHRGEKQCQQRSSNSTIPEFFSATTKKAANAIETTGASALSTVSDTG